MPQQHLLLAAPLQKTWLGTHYWKTPLLMDLPVELEVYSFATARLMLRSSATMHHLQRRAEEPLRTR